MKIVDKYEIITFGGTNVEGTNMKSLKTWRIETGYTGRKLGQIANVHYSLISKIENGVRVTFQPDTMKRIADVLNLSPHDITEFHASLNNSEINDEDSILKASLSNNNLNQEENINSSFNLSHISEPDTMDHLLEEWASHEAPIAPKMFTLLGRIRRWNQYIENDMNELMLTCGIHLSEYMVLAALRRSGPPYSLTPTKLFKTLLASSGSITKRLDILENLGLVKRTPDVNDRRSTIISLTAEGKALEEKIRKLTVANLPWTINVLADHEIDAINNALRKMLHIREQENYRGITFPIGNK